MKNYLVLNLALLTFLVYPSTLFAGTPLQRAQELISVINSGSRVQASKYIKENYSPDFLKVPLDTHLDFISFQHDQSRKIEYHSVQEEKPNQVIVLAKNQLTDEWIAIDLRTEPEPPHRIASIGVRDPVLPKDLVVPSSEISKEELVKEFDVFLHKLVDAGIFSGTVVIGCNNKPFYEKAFGLANRDLRISNQMDTKFNLASMNKMFTAIAVGQLVEQGKVSFEDPLSKFLPNYPNKTDAKRIKIKHLLSHTSGLGNYFNEKFTNSSRTRLRTVDDYMHLVQDEKLSFEPGTSWQYSNTGYVVLGAVIEKVTGRSYFDYVRENIYHRLEMKNTDSYEADHVDSHFAVAYSKEFTNDGTILKTFVFGDAGRGSPAGGGYSTADDLFQFAFNLQTERLLRGGTVKTLLSPKPELHSLDYGYGFEIDAKDQIVGHSGGFPGISNKLDLFLKNKCAYVVLSNYSNGSEAIERKLRRLLPRVKED